MGFFIGAGFDGLTLTPKGIRKGSKLKDQKLIAQWLKADSSKLKAHYFNIPCKDAKVFSWFASSPSF